MLAVRRVVRGISSDHNASGGSMVVAGSCTKGCPCTQPSAMNAIKIVGGGQCGTIRFGFEISRASKIL
jgi:spermidine synthase